MRLVLRRGVASRGGVASCDVLSGGREQRWRGLGASRGARGGGRSLPGAALLTH